MKTLSYKGYEGTVEVDLDEGVCQGRLRLVADLVTYVGETRKLLRGAFEEAVDEYLATCGAIDRGPKKPF